MVSGICVLVRQFSSSQQYFSSMFCIMFSFLPVRLQVFFSFWFTFRSLQVSLIDQSFLFLLLPPFLLPSTFSLFPFFSSSSPALPDSLPSFLHVCCLKQDLLNRYLLQSKKNTLFFSAFKGASSAVRHYSDFSSSPCLSTILSSSFSCCKNIMAGVRKHEEVQVFPATCKYSIPTKAFLNQDGLV